jgi:hypothetical protein
MGSEPPYVMTLSDTLQGSFMSNGKPLVARTRGRGRFRPRADAPAVLARSS